MQQLRQSDGKLCTEWQIAKALKLALIQFKNTGKFWATAIPDFYLKSKNVKLIKDFN